MSWPVVALGEIIAEARAGFASGKSAEDGVRQIRMNNVNPDGSWNWEKIRRVPSPKRIDELLVQSGDILFNATNSPEMVGKTAVVADLQEPTSFSNHFIRLRFDRDAVFPPYIARFLQLEHQNGLFSHICKKWVNQAAVSKEDLLAQRVPLPPLEEQKRIAGILGQADTLRRLRTRALDKLNTLGQALFYEMFEEIGAKDRTTVQLGELLTFVTSGGRGWAKYYSEVGSRFIRSLDVQMNEIGDEEVVFVTPPDNAEAKRTRVAEGDVLLTITGSKIGRVAPASAQFDGAFISQHVAILRPDRSRLLPEFLSYFLSMEQFGQKQIKAKQYGQAKPGLNFQQIRSFELPDVSISDQKKFVDRLREIEKLKDRFGTGTEETEALFGSLQHRAFRGEL